MMISLSGKIRDHAPAAASPLPKPCSPPPASRGRRGRKPAAALPDQVGGGSAIPDAARPALEAAGRTVLRHLEQVLERAYTGGASDAITHLLDHAIPEWASAAGQAVMEAVLVHERGFLGSTLKCRSCEAGHLRLEGDRHRTIRTMCGAVACKRSYYVCDSCGCGVAPLDMQLGIDGEHGFLPSVQDLVSLMGSQLSFPNATGLLRRLLPDAPSLTTVERITRTIGAAVQKNREEERQAAYGDPTNSAFPACESTTHPKVAVVAADGGMCRMRTADEPYREFKMGVLGHLVPVPGRTKDTAPPVLERAYTATFEGPDALFDFCGLEFARLGLGRAPILHVLGDGAPWIWARAADLAEKGQRVVQTLDFYHACDHIREAAHAFFGPDSAPGRDWQKARRDQLMAGKVTRFLQCVEALARKAQRLGRSSDACTIRTHHAYFRERRRFLNYKQCLDEGLLIGSGMIEGGIRFVGKDRLHRTGMRWSEPGAEAILALRGVEASGRWDRLCHERAIARKASFTSFRQAATRAA